MSSQPASWRGRGSLLARLLVAGGSVGEGPEHSVDRAPVSWLKLAGGIAVLAGLIGLVVFAL